MRDEPEMIRSIESCVNERQSASGARPHRRVKPKKGVTFQSLLTDWEPSGDGGQSVAAWPNDDLGGAEFEAWSH